ncbi:MAG: hypothetical protein J6U54_19835, partial [Clostridiales bacterium]|nr:hypothetical protein [Clostridiales bacterium]
TVACGSQYVNDSGKFQSEPYEFTIASGETKTIAVPSAGEYKVAEIDASVSGYDLSTTYDKNSVTLTDSSNTGSITINNKYEATPTDTPTQAPTQAPTPEPTTPTPVVDSDEVTPTPEPTPVTPVDTPTPAPGRLVVIVDGGEVSESNYTVDEGGKVVLKPEFVNKLTPGTHTMVTTNPDGSKTTTEFVVTSSASTSNVTSRNGVVSTGEDVNNTRFRIICILALAAVSIIIFRKRYLDCKE